MISIIAAVASDMAIGFQGKLLYWLPNDLKRFKALTSGHTVIMGRKTFESLPKGALPNRRNVVLSRSSCSFPGCEVYASLPEALASCRHKADINKEDINNGYIYDEDIYIIGGASVYAEALPLADRLCLTHVSDTPAHADAFFPKFGDEWVATGDVSFPADDRHAFAYRFTDYVRRQP